MVHQMVISGLLLSIGRFVCGELSFSMEVVFTLSLHFADLDIKPHEYNPAASPACWLYKRCQVIPH